MKNFLMSTFLFYTCSLFAQTEISEGEMYMQQLAAYDTTFVSETDYVVQDLFTRIPLADIKARALADKKPFYIDFYADYCQPCKLMEITTFKDYEVVRFTHSNFYAAQLDMTDFDAIEMQAMYKITALPTILFFDYKGNLIDRATGMQTGTLFLQKLKDVLNLSK